MPIYVTNPLENSWTLILILSYFKLLVTTEVLASRLISFIETPGPPPLGFHWHVRPAVAQTRLSLIPSLRGGVPTSLPKQLITQKLWTGDKEECGGGWGAGGWAGTGTSTLTQFLLFCRCLIHADPLQIRQPSATLTEPGPLGHSRTKTKPTLWDPSQKEFMWPKFQFFQEHQHTKMDLIEWINECIAALWFFIITFNHSQTPDIYCCHLCFWPFSSVLGGWKQHKQDPIFSCHRVKPKTIITTIVPDFCNPQNMDRIITHDNAKD